MIATQGPGLPAMATELVMTTVCQLCKTVPGGRRNPSKCVLIIRPRVSVQVCFRDFRGVHLPGITETPFGSMFDIWMQLRDRESCWVWSRPSWDLT